jgi:hypothetical protein
VAVVEVTAKVVRVVVAKVEVPVMFRLPVMLAWPFMARLPAMVEVAVDEVETKARAVEVAEVERAPVKVMPPLAVRAPVNVEAPVTARVDCRVAVPATVRDEVREAAPWTVRVLSKVEGLLERKVLLLSPPKAAELEDRLVKLPKLPEKDLAEKEPVADIELVERCLVVMDWGLNDPLIVKLLRTVLPLTVRSLSKVALSKTDKLARVVGPVAMVRDLACNRPSEIRLERVWIDLAVVKRPSEVKLK